MDKTYKIYTDSAMVFDFSDSNISPTTLVPACGYNFARTFTFTDGTGCTPNFCKDSTVFTGDASGRLTVSTINIAKVGTYKINVT